MTRAKIRIALRQQHAVFSCVFFKLPKSSNDLQKQSLGLHLGPEELIYAVVRFSGRHVLLLLYRFLNRRSFQHLGFRTGKPVVILLCSETTVEIAFRRPACIRVRSVSVP